MRKIFYANLIVLRKQKSKAQTANIKRKTEQASMEYHLQFFHFESICIFRIETSVLKTPCSSVLIFNPPHHPVPFDLVSSIHLHLR